MFEFNLQNFLNNVFVPSSSSSSSSSQPVSVNCSVIIAAEQSDDFTTAVTCFLQNLKNYLNVPETSDCFWQVPGSTDIIVMHEHGFMDTPENPGAIVSMIYAISDENDSSSYLYVTEYVPSVVTSNGTTIGSGN